MPTRCNRGFYWRSYCLLNMFRAPLCPSSGAQGYYTVVAVCGISCCGFQVAGLVWSWGLCPVCRMLQHSANRTHSPQLHTSVASSWHFISTYFLPCIWQMKAPFPTQKVSYNDRHQNDFLVILQFPQCFPYQTSWKEPTLARMYPWSVTQRHTPHPSTTGQRKEGIWSSRVSEMTISHELGNANGKLRDVFLRK